MAREQFIGERIEPAGDEVDTAEMAIGRPGLPRAFTWRGERCDVARVLATWKETGPCRHGSGEQYVRKHWFRVRAADGREMKLYFERQARSARQARARWWLYTVAGGEE